MQKIEEPASLQNQVEEVRLQIKFSLQSFHEKKKTVFEPVTDTIKNTSEKLRKTITETSINNNKALQGLTEKVSKLLNDKGMIAQYLASSLFIRFKPENKSQFKLTKDQNSIRMNDFVIHGKIPVTLYSKMVIFRNSRKCF